MFYEIKDKRKTGQLNEKYLILFWYYHKIAIAGSDVSYWFLLKFII